MSCKKQTWRRSRFRKLALRDDSFKYSNPFPHGSSEGRKNLTFCRIPPSDFIFRVHNAAYKRNLFHAQTWHKLYSMVLLLQSRLWRVSHSRSPIGTKLGTSNSYCQVLSVKRPRTSCKHSNPQITY